MEDSKSKDEILSECKRRIFIHYLPKHLEGSQYWEGYTDALGELIEWIEYDIKGEENEIQ